MSYVLHIQATAVHRHRLAYHQQQQQQLAVLDDDVVQL